jgi:hypothetical protein
LKLSQPQDHSAVGRIMSIKNSNYTIRNWTHDLPACTELPQPNAPHASQCTWTNWKSTNPAQTTNQLLTEKPHSFQGKFILLKWLQD